MPDLQSAKKLIRDFHQELMGGKAGSCSEIINRYTASDALWRLVHPFDTCQDNISVAKEFWEPLKSRITSLHQREDIFFAGLNEMDNQASVWVVSMGHLVGLFDHEWIGIKPNGKMAFLRYCLFHKVEDGRIKEITLHADLPHLMAQLGQSPFGTQTGAHLVQPGPRTHDGLLYQPQSEAEGRATLAKINSMIGNLGQWKSNLPLEEELAIDWHQDMVWWGPAGIGSTFTIPRYAQQHSAPFRAGFTNRSKTNHIARLAEGHYGGFFGWPNFTAEPTGGFMGMPAIKTQGEFRVIDLYRRDGDKLAENWVFIDLLHFYKSCGMEITLPA